MLNKDLWCDEGKIYGMMKECTCHDGGRLV